ncbi:hypothetical protein JCM11641_007937 [Rhodosporidiobolus odoratus]
MPARIPRQTWHELDEKLTLENRLEAAVTLLQALRTSPGQPQPHVLYGGDVALAAMTKDMLSQRCTDPKVDGKVLERALMERDGEAVEVYSASGGLAGIIAGGGRHREKEYKQTRMFKNSNAPYGHFRLVGDRLTWQPIYDSLDQVPFLDLDGNVSSPFHRLFGGHPTGHIDYNQRFGHAMGAFFRDIEVKDYAQVTIEEHFPVFTSPLLILTSVAEIFHADRDSAGHGRSDLDQHWWTVKILYDCQNQDGHREQHDKYKLKTIYKSLNRKEVKRLLDEVYKLKNDEDRTRACSDLEVKLMEKMGLLHRDADPRLGGWAASSWQAMLRFLFSLLYDAVGHHPDVSISESGPLGAVSVFRSGNPGRAQPRPGGGPHTAESIAAQFAANQKAGMLSL